MYYATRHHHHHIIIIIIWINSTVLVMGRDLFIFDMLSPAELKRSSKDPALTGSIFQRKKMMMMMITVNLPNEPYFL
jgi:hypothetical protein